MYRELCCPRRVSICSTFSQGSMKMINKLMRRICSAKIHDNIKQTKPRMQKESKENETMDQFASFLKLHDMLSLIMLTKLEEQQQTNLLSSDSLKNIK